MRGKSVEDEGGVLKPGGRGVGGAEAVARVGSGSHDDDGADGVGSRSKRNAAGVVTRTDGRVLGETQCRNGRQRLGKCRSPD